MKKKYYIETFGCQMNVHDSEKMSGILKAEGMSETSDPADADILIFNTCSIREKAEQKFFSSLGRLRYLKKNNPALKIAVAGCIAQQEGARILKRTPYVDYVIGPQNLHIFKDIDSIKAHSIACDENPLIAESDFEVDRKDNIKAWVTIMYGCDNYCSYCVVPYTRGREISRPGVKIIEEVEGLAREGFREIIFLGQNVNSYKSNLDFPSLLKRINDVRGVERIRFVTSHPKDLSEALIYSIRDLEKVCEHIHLPLQSGSTRILKLMNRKYSYEEYLEKIRLLRKVVPDISITTDIIAGFPQESAKDHEETINALKEISFDGMFAFKYSHRPETSAAALEDHLDDDIKSKRLYEIIEVQNQITDIKNKILSGSNQQILIETISDSGEGLLYQGRTRTNKIVNCTPVEGSCREYSVGDLVDVVITKTARHSLSGVIK